MCILSRSGKSGILHVDGRKVGVAESDGILTSLDTSGNVFIGLLFRCFLRLIVRPSPLVVIALVIMNISVYDLCAFCLS